MGTADHLTLLRLFNLFLITQAVQLAIGGETLGETWMDSLRAKLKEHFHSFWNILDAFIILFIIATVIIRAWAALDTSDDQTPASNNASNRTDVWKLPPVSYRTSALWGRCPRRRGNPHMCDSIGH